MSSTRRTIAKNASVLMGGQLITWVLAIALTVFMPRYLGAEAIGKFHLASSLWAIMTIFVSFGMDTLLTKEIARAPEKTVDLFGTSIFLRLVFFVAGFGLLALYTHLAGYPPETTSVIYIIGVANLIVQFYSTCQAALQGLERMEYISLSDIVSKAFITIVSIALLLLGFGVIPVACVVIGGAGVSLLIQFLALNRLQKLRLRFNKSLAKWMLKASVPYLLNVGIRTLYIQIDIVVISLLVNETVIGWYSAADRLFSTLLFIPAVFVAVVFPTMARLHVAAPDQMLRFIRKNFNLMLLLGIPVGLGVFLIADPLVVLLFGPEFARSGPVLATMGIVLILTYQNMLMGQFLISSDRQSIWTWVMAIATASTILLDLILIPWCQAVFQNGAIGGALSFVVTEAGMTVTGVFLLPKGALTKGSAWLALRALFAGLGMLAVAWWWRWAFILLPVIIGAVTYLGLILILRVVPKEDWNLIVSLGQSLLARFRKPKTEPTRIGG